MPIQKLNQDLINKIAAGEVVERPFSVVKELIENSIDAQSSSITLELKNGGLDYISVADNGLGMTKDDALLSVERHTTSKISKIEDLFKIYTMGFRGEALSSISAVSKFTIQTKKANSLEGTQVNVSDGQIQTSVCGCPDGTKVIVENLFYNVPVRKKFLKAQNTEYNHILEFFINFALIYPNINFKLIHNGKETLNFTQTEKWLERIKQALGGDLTGKLIDVERKGTINIKGYIGKPEIARNNKKAQYLFINNRIVNDFLISKAVKEAYGTLIPRELYPIYVLKIDIPPELVDVNVHPQKAEVRFQAPNDIFLAVLGAIKNILLNNNLTPSLDLISDKMVKEKYEAADSSGMVFKPKSFTGFQSENQRSWFKIPTGVSAVNQSLAATKEFLNTESGSEAIPDNEAGQWRLLGQIYKSYLLVESSQGLLIIDQHAAAERIKYEKLKRELNSAQINSQKLLIPLTIELSAAEAQILKEAQDNLKKIGFDIENFGSNTFIINAVPMVAADLDQQSVVLGILSDLQNSDFGQLKSLEDKADLILKYTACRSAVKFQDQLQSEEQIQLLKDIQQILNQINTCPHGRPFLIELSLDNLKKYFLR